MEKKEEVKAEIKELKIKQIVEVGGRIRMLRNKRHISCDELANRIGLSCDYVRKIEVEAVDNLRIDIIALIAKGLEVHPSVVAFGDILAGIAIQDQMHGWELSDNERHIIDVIRSKKDDPEIFKFLNYILTHYLRIPRSHKSKSAGADVGAGTESD